MPSSQASTPGVVYRPSSMTGRRMSLEAIHHTIQYIRIQWVDLTNTVRFRVLPLSYFKRLFSSSSPSIGLTSSTLGMVGAGLAPGFSVAGELLYVVDLNSYRVCEYAPGHAVVMGWFRQKIPSPSGHLAYPLCPRTLLQRITDEAHQRAGLTFLAGFESEFILLSATSPIPVEAGRGDWSCSAKCRTGSVQTDVMNAIAEVLQDAGIELQMWHAEAAPGQFEVVTGPLAPLEAADAIVFTRETIYNVANKHGLRATFAPRLHGDNCGNGAHVHISMHSTQNTASSTAPTSSAVFGPTLTPTERSFLQTLLQHLPALCALILPTEASYARVLDGIWSGGTYACWGTENKDTPVRLCGPSGAHHFELKCGDATANPYIALAGVLAAGLRGVLEGAELMTGDCVKPAAQMNEAERAAVGLENPGRLPRTIEDARKVLAADGYLRGALGEEFVEKYFIVNELFQKHLSSEDPAVRITRLLDYF